MFPDAPIAHPDCNPNANESAFPVLPELMIICSLSSSPVSSGAESLDLKFWSANGVMGIKTMISVSIRADVRSETGRMPRVCAI
jgi:hypothetical protein